MELSTNLPKAMPRFAGFQISGRLLAANDVGGDCFDLIPSLVDGRECLDILVGDASGHGIAAALMMAETRAYVRALALTCEDLGTLLALTNRRLLDAKPPRCGQRSDLQQQAVDQLVDLPRGFRPCDEEQAEAHCE